MAIKGGKMTALVGHSGSGKSTLLNLIPRIYDPTSGHILIDGQIIKDVNLLSLEEKNFYKGCFLNAKGFGGNSSLSLTQPPHAMKYSPRTKSSLCNNKSMSSRTKKIFFWYSYIGWEGSLFCS